MGYNQDLARRVKMSLQLFPEIFTEKKMFGGVSFLFKGKMTIGVMKDKLMVRVLSSKMDDYLKHSYVHPMDFTKQNAKEFIYVTEKGFETEEAILKWIDLGLEHAKSKL